MSEERMSSTNGCQVAFGVRLPRAPMGLPAHDSPRIDRGRQVTACPMISRRADRQTDEDNRAASRPPSWR
jgi:hypothetical protein